MNNDTELKEKAFFCPTCGSASVNAPMLAGAEASCNTCTWRGPTHELALLRFDHGMGSPEQVAHNFMIEVRNLLTKNFAMEMGRMLMKWGFMPANETKLFARYMGAIARGISTAIVQERQAIDKERGHG